MNKLNHKGFTLAELLVTLAITMALTGLAMPGFISVLNNMRMNELNSAANSIATAAQSRMTSMKTSGTWISTLEEKSEYLDQRAVHLQNANADIFYFTAEQARDNGVLPRNSIDDTVWNSDYIIEYSRSTATVCGIFYSNGTGSFFSSSGLESDGASNGESSSGISSTLGTPAKDYYLAMTSSAGRDEQARMNASPMIGYYWGTPAGATDTVVLDNPIIWIDEETNHLQVQNINLRNDDYKTSLQLTISRVDADQVEIPEYQFVISGLKENLSLVSDYSITTKQRIQDGTGGLDLTSEGEITLKKRSDNSSQADVYSIDLTQILSHLTGADSTHYADLIAIAQGFTSDSDIKIEAEVSTTSEATKGATPTTAKAYAKWPGQVLGRLSMLVTNPNYFNKASHITGSYTKPKVEMTDKNGNSPLGPVPDTYPVSETYEVYGTHYTLRGENSEAAYQSYSGRSALIPSAVSAQAHMLATVGSYTSLDNSGFETKGMTHHYQIFEMWLNTTKIGYLHNNAWTWTAAGTRFAECIASGPTAGLDTAGIRSVRVNPQTLAAIAPSLAALGINTSDGFTLYIRTTPAQSEVYANISNGGILGLLTMLSNEQGQMEGNALVSSRTNIGGSGRSISAVEARRCFETEFGASSAVASWSFIYDGDSDVSGLESGFRYYYAGTPAFGFPFNMNINNPDNKADNTTLWYWEEGWNLVPQAQALVQDPRTSGGISDGLTHYTLIDGEYTDFELSHTKDALFYRLLIYHASTGEVVGSQQYVPHVIENAEILRTGSGQSSNFWRTADTFSPLPNGRDLFCLMGASVGANYNYDGTDLGLRWGRVDLYASAHVLGLVYSELYSDGTRGYYGFTDSRLTNVNIDQGMDYVNAKTIVNWEYFLILPGDMVSSGINPQFNWNNMTASGLSFYTSATNTTYSCYSLTGVIPKSHNRNLECVFSLDDVERDIYHATYFLNMNFAKAVTTQRSVADNWGSKLANYPYLVRHIDQFVGCINPAFRDSYMGSNFKQEHSIYFNDAYPAPVYGNYAFSGIYNGNGHKIFNYKPGAHGVNTNTALYVGLFYRATSDSIGAAELRNINLENLVNATVPFDISGTHSVYRVFAGYLVGDARETVIENCTVTGYGRSNTVLAFPATGNATQSRNYYLNFGGIVGWATDSSITDCRVAGLTLKATTSGITDGVRYSMGGLLGHSSLGVNTVGRNNSYTNLIVQNVSLDADISRNNSNIGIGALVGTILHPESGAFIVWLPRETSVGSSYAAVISTFDGIQLSNTEYLGRNNRITE